MAERTDPPVAKAEVIVSASASDPAAAPVAARGPDDVVSDTAAATGIDADWTSLAIEPPADKGQLTSRGDATTEAATIGDDFAALVERSPTATPAVRQLGIAITRHVSPETDRFTVALRPEELGSVEVLLELGGDGLARAQFIAERAETLDLLRRDMAELERSLRAVGLDLANNGMTFTMRDQGGSRDRHRAPMSPTIDLASEPIASRSAPATPGPRVGERLLDLSV